MRIWKYIMKDYDFSVKMPKGAQVLSCQMQGDLPSIWILADEDAPKEVRRFIGVETGKKIETFSEKIKFIDTIQDEGTVNHIFEVL